MQFLVAAQTASFKFVKHCYFSITYRDTEDPAHGATADPDGHHPAEHDMAKVKNILPREMLAHLEQKLAMRIST